MANGGVIGPITTILPAKCLSAAQTVKTSSGTHTFQCSSYGQNRPVNIVVVAGGGGGGCAGRNGAGGAGGLRNNMNIKNSEVKN